MGRRVRRSASRVGPVAGGVLLQHFWWGSVFLVNVPVVMHRVGRWATCSSPTRRTRTRASSIPSARCCRSSGSAILLWAIIEGPSNGWASATVLGGFVVGGGGARRGSSCGSSQCSNPMLDVRFFENPRFSAASGAITLAFLALFGTIFLLTQYMQQVLGYSTVEAGRGVRPAVDRADDLRAAVDAVGAHASATRPSSRPGCSSSRASLLLMATFQTDTAAWWVIAITALSALGMAHVVAPATESIMGSLPRAKAGVGSAMNDTTRQVGGAVGVALLGSILASAFRPKVQDLLHGSVPRRLARQGRGLARQRARRRARQPGGASRSPDRSSTPPSTASSPACTRPCSSQPSSRVIGAIGVLIWLPARARTHPDDIDLVAQDPDAIVEDASHRLRPRASVLQVPISGLTSPDRREVLDVWCARYGRGWRCRWCRSRCTWRWP